MAQNISAVPVTKVCFVQCIPEAKLPPVNAIAYIQSSFLLAEESSGKQLQNIPYTAITSMEANIYSGEITIIYDMEGMNGESIGTWLYLKCDATDVMRRCCVVDFIHRYMDFVYPSPENIEVHLPSRETPSYIYRIQWPAVKEFITGGEAISSPNVSNERDGSVVYNYTATALPATNSAGGVQPKSVNTPIRTPKSPMQQPPPPPITLSNTRDHRMSITTTDIHTSKPWRAPPPAPDGGNNNQRGRFASEQRASQTSPPTLMLRRPPSPPTSPRARLPGQLPPLPPDKQQTHDTSLEEKKTGTIPCAPVYASVGPRLVNPTSSNLASRSDMSSSHAASAAFVAEAMRARKVEQKTHTCSAPTTQSQHQPSKEKDFKQLYSSPDKGSPDGLPLSPPPTSVLRSPPPPPTYPRPRSLGQLPPLPPDNQHPHETSLEEKSPGTIACSAKYASLPVPLANATSSNLASRSEMSPSHAASAASAAEAMSSPDGLPLSPPPTSVLRSPPPPPTYPRPRLPGQLPPLPPDNQHPHETSLEEKSPGTIACSTVYASLAVPLVNATSSNLGSRSDMSPSHAASAASAAEAMTSPDGLPLPPAPPAPPPPPPTSVLRSPPPPPTYPRPRSQGQLPPLPPDKQQPHETSLEEKSPVPVPCTLVYASLTISHVNATSSNLASRSEMSPSHAASAASAAEAMSCLDGLPLPPAPPAPAPPPPTSVLRSPPPPPTYPRPCLPGQLPPLTPDRQQAGDRSLEEKSLGPVNPKSFNLVSRPDMSSSHASTPVLAAEAMRAHTAEQKGHTTCSAPTTQSQLQPLKKEEDFEQLYGSPDEGAPDGLPSPPPPPPPALGAATTPRSDKPSLYLPPPPLTKPKASAKLSRPTHVPNQSS